MKQFHQNIIFCALLFLTACSTTIQSDVIRDHRLTRPSGESIAVIPMHLAQDPQSPEFRNYANMVRENMALLGYTLANNAKSADLIVELGYGVKRIKGSPHNQYPFLGYYSWPHNWYYGRYWGGYHRYHYPYFGPFYDPWWYNNSYHDRLYNRSLSLDIRNSGGEKLFEGRVESVGRTKNLIKSIPLMIEAMFVDFPGESGTIKRITIREDVKKK